MPNAPETPIDGGNRTVELYVRSLAPRAAHGQLEEFVETLDALESRGDVLDYTVHVWGSRIDSSSAAAETDAGQFIRERVRAFTRWASENGLSTGSFFEEEPVESSITGEEYSAVTLPTATLAEYVDGELSFVAPCTNGESMYTIDDRLEALENSGQATNGPRQVQTQTN